MTALVLDWHLIAAVRYVVDGLVQVNAVGLLGELLQQVASFPCVVEIFHEKDLILLFANVKAPVTVASYWKEFQSGHQILERTHKEVV